MKIREKLLSLPSIVLVMMVLLGIVATYSMNNMRQTVIQIYDVNLQNHEISSDILTDATRANIAVYRLFTWLNNLNDSEIKKQSDEIGSLVDAAVQKTEKLKTRPGIDTDDRSNLDDISRNLSAYKKQIIQSIDYAQIDPNMGLAEMRTADESFQRITKQIIDLVSKTQKTSKNAYDEGLSAANSVTTGFVVLVLIAVVLSISLSLLIGGKIISSVKEAISTAQRIARGDLTGHIVTHTEDEIGELLHALDNMQSSLHHLVTKIIHSSQLLSNVTHEISDSSKTIAYGTSEQNGAAATMASAIEEMTQGITVINAHAQDANSAMSGSKQLTEEERSILGKVKDSMGKIEESSVNNQSVVESLGKESERISDIINVIRSIAEQTNLLALNAAIEAARAGEQGRGFAVVADEVRSLAARTASSTQEITAMIGAIQKQVSAAVNGMASSVQIVEDGSKLTVSAQEAVTRSTNQISNVATMVSEISRALHEQRTASEVIAKEVHHIAEMAEKNNHAASNTTSHIASLNQLANELQESVQKFRV